MLATCILTLTLLSYTSSAEDLLNPYPTFRRNASHKLRGDRINTEEVLLLNRHFVDYIITVDNETVKKSSDLHCAALIHQLADAYLNHEQHGLEWFDSWGTIPVGPYFRNRYALGSVDQCRAIGEIRMQHCSFDGAFPNELQSLVIGLCVPHVCNSDFVQRLYGSFLMTKGFQLKPTAEQQLHCVRDEEIVYDGAMITAIFMSALIGLAVVCCTLYELLTEALHRSSKPLYTSFSLSGNLRSILYLAPRVNTAQQKSNMIECAHGIRALSMICILVVHVNEFLRFVPLENESARLDYFRGFVSSVLYSSASFAVDTFLALSGMLAAMSMLRELDKKGRLNLMKLYLQRYIRITAPLAALILFAVSFAGYMGEGVFWKQNIDRMKLPCVKNWWAALLHIQNYVDPGNMCLPWTWYLSVDMQLYLFAPALIYPLWRYGNRFLFFIIGFAVLSMVYVSATFYLNGFRLSYFAPGSKVRRFVLTYYATHARMTVWLWGLAFGYLLHSTKDTGVNLPKRHWIAGWITCFFLLGSFIFANYQIQASNVEEYSFVVDAFYETLSRSVFAFCVLWIILACVNRKGWLVDEFLGASMWQPLSRLSFTMYLLHIPLLVMASVASAKTASHFSGIELFYRICGTIGLTTVVALLWSAVFEMPFMILSKLILS